MRHSRRVIEDIYDEILEKAMLLGALHQACMTGHLETAWLMSPVEMVDAVKERAGDEAGLTG